MMSQPDPHPIGNDRSERLDLSERHKLMRDGLVNNLTLVVSGLIGLIIVPLMLKWLGEESYGIWIVAMATTAMLSMVDFGLYPTVVREVSTSLRNGPGTDTILFVEGAGNAYLLLGIAGALLLGFLGYSFSGSLHLTAQLQSTARWVFWLVGVGFCLDQLTFFGTTVLIGARRFGYANLIRSGAAISRAAGIVLLLTLGKALVAIVLWQAVVAALGVAATFTLLRRQMPHFHFRIARLHWTQLRGRVSFALSSMLAMLFGGLAWESGSLLIGLLQGSALVVPFYIGKKLPFAASQFGAQVTEAMFPATGEDLNSLLRTRDILRVGARWVLVLMLPVTILLCVLGPKLLTVWIGYLDPKALQVLRLMALAALADGFMGASLNVLWGRAVMRRVVFTLLGVAVGTVCLTLLLVPKMGVTGAAWGALLPLFAGACLMFHLACRECRTRSVHMLGSLLEGLPLPVVGCAAATYIVSVHVGSGIWPLIASCLAGSVTYIGLLLAVPGLKQEKQFIESAFRRVTDLL